MAGDFIHQENEQSTSSILATIFLLALVVGAAILWASNLQA